MYMKEIEGVPTKCSLEDERKKMVIFRNSLQNQLHFKQLLNQPPIREYLVREDGKFVGRLLI